MAMAMWSQPQGRSRSRSRSRRSSSSSTSSWLARGCLICCGCLLVGRGDAFLAAPPAGGVRGAAARAGAMTGTRRAAPAAVAVHFGSSRVVPWPPLAMSTRSEEPPKQCDTPAATAATSTVTSAARWVEEHPERINFAVVGVVALFAVSRLIGVDEELSRGWAWYEVLLRIPQDNFWLYESTVTAHPVITKACTSMTAYAIGDFLAQILQGKDLKTVDLVRTARSATAGFVVHGPLCHYEMEFFARFLDFNGAWWNFLPKVFVDQTVWSVFLNAMYTTFVIGLQGKPPKEIYEAVTSTAWPAITSSWRFWPLVHCVSFNDAIPKDLKLAFVDCMEIIWITILSRVANKDSEKEGGSDAAGGSH